VISAAVGTATATTKPEAKRVREAMRQAVIAALAEGVTDSDEILARQLAARDAVLGAS